MDPVEEKDIIHEHLGESIEIEADFAGRPLYYFDGKFRYRRSPDGRWVELRRDAEIVTRELGNEDVTRVERSFFDVLSESGNEQFRSLGMCSFDKYLSFLKKDCEAYMQLYGIKPIFPPMMLRPMYLSLSRGSEWNFCNVFGEYKNPAHSTYSEREFAEHVGKVRDYFGVSFQSRHSIYLGDARAIDTDQKALLNVMDFIMKDLNLPVTSAFDIYSTPKKKNMIGYRELKEHGLSRMYVYVESGSYKVIRLLNRNINITEAMNDISNIKDHGIPVSIVVMAGTGGLKLEKDHVKSTANLISQLLLDERDRIYLSPVIQDADPYYRKVIEDNALGVMSMEQILQQMRELRNELVESYADFNGNPLKTEVVDWDLRVPAS